MRKISVQITEDSSPHGRLSVDLISTFKAIALDLPDGLDLDQYAIDLREKVQRIEREYLPRISTQKSLCLYNVWVGCMAAYCIEMRLQEKLKQVPTLLFVKECRSS
jgi:surfactin synthase thioesterase subunit